MALNAAANAAEYLMGNIGTNTANIDNERKSDEEMLALCWMGPEKVQVQKVPKPALTDPTDVILKVVATTVCGSDLNLLHGEVVQLKKGDILGHECVGVIEQCGSDVKQFQRGQRVVAPFAIACGSCESCSKGNFTTCLRTNNSKLQNKTYGHRLSGVLGYSHMVGGFAGCQAEYVRIPFADVNLIAVPESLPDEKALFLADIGSTSYHAVRDSGAQEGEIIGVWGLGPVGLLVCQWLRNVVKAKRIIGIDDVPERLELAEKAFGVETLDFSKHKNVVGRLQEMLGGEGADLRNGDDASEATTIIGLDRAIDCSCCRYAKNLLHKVERAVGLETDTSEMINEMLRIVKPFGTVALIADYFGYANHLLIGAVMEKGIRLIGCGQAPTRKYADEVTKYMLDGSFDPTVILTHHFDLSEIDKAYKKFDNKEAGVIKVFIRTRFSKDVLEHVPPLTKVDEAVPRRAFQDKPSKRLKEI